MSHETVNPWKRNTSNQKVHAILQSEIEVWWKKRKSPLLQRDSWFSLFFFCCPKCTAFLMTTCVWGEQDYSGKLSGRQCVCTVRLIEDGIYFPAAPAQNTIVFSEFHVLHYRMALMNLISFFNTCTILLLKPHLWCTNPTPWSTVIKPCSFKNKADLVPDLASWAYFCI